MNDWVNAHYEFGTPMKGVIVSATSVMKGTLNKINIYELFAHPERAELYVKADPLFDALPADAILVRMSLPQNQDAVIFYFISKEFKPLKGYELMEIVPIESLKKSKAQ